MEFFLTNYCFQCTSTVGLPSIAKQEGCALFVPKTTTQQNEANPYIGIIQRFLDLCGGYVECETEEIMNG